MDKVSYPFQIRFAEPAYVHRYTDELAELVNRLAQTYDTRRDGATAS